MGKGFRLTKVSLGKKNLKLALDFAVARNCKIGGAQQTLNKLSPGESPIPLMTENNPAVRNSLSINHQLYDESSAL